MLRLFLTLLLCSFSLPAYAFDLGAVLGSQSQNSDDAKRIKRIEQAFRFVSALIPISDAEEKKLGRGVAAKVIGKYGIADMPYQTYYLNLIGTALAQHSDRPQLGYHFAILDTDDVNAYAAPGGYIFVTRGLLNTVHDEAELAAVLAHEIAHVTERHIIKALQQSRVMQVGKEAVADAFAKSAGPLFDKMTDFATDALFNGLKKSDEYDSDTKAIVYLDRLGYDYPAMFDLLKLLDARRKAGRTKVLSKTHPNPQDRIRHLHVNERKLHLEPPTGIRLGQRFDRYQSKKTAS
jgi:predicted Zn-dependent protease